MQALERFYEAVMQAILRHINFDGRAARLTHSHLFLLHYCELFWFVLVSVCRYL